MDNTESNKSETAKREEKILKFWEENKIFEKSLEKPATKGEFVFYEGPPTANGKPGIHHLEARAFKDIIPRYKTMRGYHVRRKGGWDTHGLPVELQVEKQLGLKSKKEVEEYGVEKFNKKCKESVWEYVDLWEKFTKRIGYWVDQENPYITYQNSYIESVWHVLKKVEEQKLLYKDYKVVPWCPRCGTALSSHELAQGYEDVKDLSVYVKFKIKNPEKISLSKEAHLLAWTTTPWTLPGNVALAVGENIEYVVVKNIIISKINAVNNPVLRELLISVTDSEGNSPFILWNGKNITEEQFWGNFKTVKGKDLVGLEYEPLYEFSPRNENSHKVYSADFVNTEDGTGIVHTAVMYGQDDFELGTEVGLPKYHLVGEDGRFLEETGFLSGRFVKEIDEKGKPTLAVDIIEDLKKRNLFFSQENIKHSYPHCWRCKTALIYYARDSWYIRMSSLREKLVGENEKINWVPSYIKEGRFGEWLREVKDWAISRERFWGTPLPVWKNDKGEVVVVGSIEELKKKIKKSGNKYWTMRHGEAESNKADLINSDPKNIYHLTEDGKSQVQIVAQDLKSKSIDLILVSPFARCIETAEIVRKALDLPESSVKIEEKIGEFKKGPDFEGKAWDGYWSLFKSVKERFEKSPDGGENLLDLNRRLGGFLYEIEKEYSGKNILIVSHQGPVTAMHIVAEGADLDRAIEIREKKIYQSGFAELLELSFVPLPHNEGYELDLHKPYIDQVELINENGDKLTRAKEVMDVWFDSGAMPFAQDGLPDLTNIKYPADYISEAIDQTRGWFYTLHAIGVLMGKGQAYKNVVCLGHILDAEGKKMSKSLGNIIDPWLMIDKYGVDALRVWMYTVNQPGDSKNFDERTVDEIVKKILNPLENILSFYELYADIRVEPGNQSTNILDRWVIARLNRLLREGTENLDKYQIFEAGRAIRDFINDFSTWYIRRSRERFKSDDVADREQALGTTRFVLLELAKYMAPFTPFFAEHLYLNLKNESDPESVHLCGWPEIGDHDQNLIDKMAEVRRIVSLALERRMTAGIKVRQPLQKLKIKSEKLKSSDTSFLELIKDEVNVKEIIFEEQLEGEVELDTEITEELKIEGEVRDMIRTIQDLRKEMNLTPNQKVILQVPESKKGIVESNKNEIVKPTNVSEIEYLEIENYKLKIKIA